MHVKMHTCPSSSPQSCEEKSKCASSLKAINTKKEPSKETPKKLSFGIDQILRSSSAHKADTKVTEQKSAIRKYQPLQEDVLENSEDKHEIHVKVSKDELRTNLNDSEVATDIPRRGDSEDKQSSLFSNSYRCTRPQAIVEETNESKTNIVSSVTPNSTFSIDSLITHSQTEVSLAGVSPAYYTSYASALLARLRSGGNRPSLGPVLQSLHNSGYTHAGDHHSGIAEHSLFHWPLTQRDRFGVVRRVGHPYQNRAPPKRKKPRTAFSRSQIAELEKRFHRQKYLASAERSSLAKQLKMSDAQVKTWFQNRRTKWRRQTAEEREIERQAAQKFLMSLRTEEEGPVYTQMCIPPPSPAAPCLPVSCGREGT